MLFRINFMVLLSLIFLNLKAQDKSNWGRDFWLGYGFNYSFFNEPPVNGQELQLYISASSAANVTVSIPGSGWAKSFSIPANTVDFSVLVPKTGADDARITGEGKFNRGISIQSDVPVAVYAHQYNTMVSGATLLMPVESYGYTYYSVNYTQSQSGSTSPDFTPVVQNGPQWYSWFYVVAPEDNTKVLITPVDTTENNWLPGSTYEVILNKGEIYNVMGKLRAGSSQPFAASKDMTGSKIVSVPGSDGVCHPIAVFSGSSGIRLCKGDGGEYMGQQMFPSQAWGTRYLTYHMINNSQTDVQSPFLNFYRVCVLDSTTIVKRNGVVLTGLRRGFYYEYSSTSGDYIEADKPILVSQYTPNNNECSRINLVSYGDPEMIYLSPIEQGQKSILFYTTRKSFIDYVYVSIYVSTAGISSLKVDGAAIPSQNIIPHPSLPGYSVAVARILGAAAQHTITSDSTFNAVVYGVGLFESYGYNAGMLLNNLNAYASITNQYSQATSLDTITCKGSPFTANLNVAYNLNKIHWRLSELSELGSLSDTVINNPIALSSIKIYGRSYYRYSLSKFIKINRTGTFKIPVTYYAEDIDKCDQRRDTVITVVVKDGPIADFAIPAVNCVGSSINLSAGNVTGFKVTGYKWYFPDGTTENTKDVSRTFGTGGDRLVRLTVITDIGCAADTTKKLVVTDPAGLKFTVTGKPCVDSTLSLESSFVSGNGISATWYWEYADGLRTSNKSSHVTTQQFKKATTNILVRHWVVNDQGCNSDTVTGNIPVIHPSAVASMNIVADTFCIGSAIAFQIADLQNISEWQLIPEPGMKINRPHPYVHRYKKDGKYLPELIITNKFGCGSPPFTKELIIKPPPDLEAGPDQFRKKGWAASLTPTIGFPAEHDIRWTPSTYLDKDDVISPVCTPNTDIKYVVKATSKLTFCSSSDTLNVFVLSDINIPNTFTPNGDGINDNWRILFLDQYKNCQVEVYTSSGQVIFKSSGYSASWDGTFRGKAVPFGTYYYVIDLGDGSSRLTGYVTVIR
jgi:gliding motility-associated-like protein